MDKMILHSSTPVFEVYDLNDGSSFKDKILWSVEHAKKSRLYSRDYFSLRVNGLVDNGLICQTTEHSLSILHNFDPIIAKYLVLRIDTFTTLREDKRATVYYLDFKGPEHLAVLWKLSS